MARVGTTQTIEAESAEYPQKTAYGWRVTAYLLENGKRTGKILLYLQDSMDGAAPGDRLTGQAKLEDAGLAERQWYYPSTGIFLTGKQRGQWQRTPAAATPLRYWPAVLSHKVAEEIETLFPQDVSGFMKALLTGQRDGLDDTVRARMTAAGIYHAVAISGMHVGILVAMLSLVLRKKKRLLAVVGIPVILLFMAFTAGAPSVIRAGVMVIVFLLAPVFGREADSLTSLAFALLLLTVGNPYALYSWGLQLSFGAAAGILLFSGRLRSAMLGAIRPAKGTRRMGTRALRGLADAVSVYAGANAFTMPLAAVYFGAVPVLGILGNVLALWAVTVLFAGGLIACGIGFVSPGLGGLFAQGLGVLVRYVLTVCKGISRIPYCAIDTAGPYMTLFLLFYLAVSGVLLFCWHRRTVLVGVGSLLCGFAVCLLLSSAAVRGAQFTFSALDVGQGQCLYFSSGDFSMLVDCGGSGGAKAGDTAVGYLQAAGCTSLDCVVLSHYDMDHIAGLERLLNRISVEVLYLPDVWDDTGNRTWAEDAAREAGVRTAFLTEPETLACQAGMVRLYPPVSEESDNESCLSVLWNLDEFRILATGDMNTEAESVLLSRYAIEKVDVLVAGHHGSASSTGSRLLAITRPELVIISVGENAYGHPTERTLERIGNSGAQCCRTDQLGTVTIRR